MQYHPTSNLPLPSFEGENIQQLAQLIEKALLHFNQYRSSCESTYLNHLCLISNCYQLVLIEMGEQRPVFQFSALRIRHSKQMSSYAFQIAEMINTVTSKACLIDYPWFYPQFIRAVKYILNDTLCCPHLKIAHTLLKQLLQHPVRASQ